MTKLTYQFIVCLLWKKRGPVFTYPKNTVKVLHCIWMVCTRVRPGIMSGRIIIVDWLLTWVNTPELECDSFWQFGSVCRCLLAGKPLSYTMVFEFLYQNCIRWDQNDPHKPGKYSGILVLSAININGIQLFYFRRVLWADFRTRTKRKIHNRRQWDALFWLNCNNERFGLK